MFFKPLLLAIGTAVLLTSSAAAAEPSCSQRAAAAQILSNMRGLCRSITLEMAGIDWNTLRLITPAPSMGDAERAIKASKLMTERIDATAEAYDSLARAMADCH